MDDQNQNKMFMPTQGEDTSTQPPRFHRPHISQEPINDPEPEYVTRNRYQTLEDAQTGRKHMGVASGDPVYLKDASSEGLSAKYADGILTVTVPKIVEKKNVTKISID